MHPKPLIINRSSIVKGSHTLSRSIEERVVEPLSWLAEKNLKFNYSIANEASASAHTLEAHTHCIMNRPHSEKGLNLLRIAKEAGIVTIVDIDDIPILFPKGDLAALTNQSKKWFLMCAKEADIITSSTHAISNWIKENVRPDASIVIPTAMNFQRFESSPAPLASHIENSISITNAGSIKLGNFKESWLQTTSKFLKQTGWMLDLISDQDTDFHADFPIRKLGQMPWRTHKAFLLKNAYPLALVPLASREDSMHMEYAKLKTPTKFISYGGSGIPAIFSDNPIYANHVSHGITGYIAGNTAEEWHNALMEMTSNIGLRRKIANNAKEFVRTHHEISKSAMEWLRLLG